MRMILKITDVIEDALAKKGLVGGKKIVRWLGGIIGLLVFLITFVFFIKSCS